MEGPQAAVLQSSAGTERREPLRAPGRRGLPRGFTSAPGAPPCPCLQAGEAHGQRAAAGLGLAVLKAERGLIPAKENRLGNTGLPNAPTGDSRSSKPHALLEGHRCPWPAAGPTARPTHVAPRSAGLRAGCGAAELWVRAMGAGRSGAAPCRAPAQRRQRCRCVYRRALEANVLFANRPPPSAAAPPKDNNRVLSAGCEGQPPGEQR